MVTDIRHGTPAKPQMQTNPRTAEEKLSSDETAAIRVSEVFFSYGQTTVLHNISFAVPKGSVCGIFGPNGSGKTTLFRCCLGLLQPDAGEIRIDGTLSEAMRIADLAKKIAYAPQDPQAAFSFRVHDIVAMGRTPHMRHMPWLSPADSAAVHNAMRLAGIENLGDTRYASLSGGQRQLVNLARAIAQETPLILLDEPTSALDFSNQILIWQALKRVAFLGVTVLVCCHDPNHILWFCDQAAVLQQGRLIAFGPVRESLSPNVLHTLYGDCVTVTFVNKRPFITPALEHFTF